MKISNAVAVLTVPLALTWMLFLAVLCLTPFWACNIQIPSSFIDIWKPAFFVIIVLSIVAIIVLMIDFLILQAVHHRVHRYRSVVTLIVGGVVATIPVIILNAFTGQGFNAFNPQIEYLPFTIAGSAFILFLARLIKI